MMCKTNNLTDTRKASHSLKYLVYEKYYYNDIVKYRKKFLKKLLSRIFDDKNIITLKTLKTFFFLLWNIS